ncbi:MAG: polyphenol oxidase family protein [Blastochloris sp.]|nr:polyphenol oxidase family protein [Blastochloris sp.]
MPSQTLSLRFPELQHPQVTHAFTLRDPEADPQRDARQALAAIDFPQDPLILAAQPHSNQVACVTTSDAGGEIPDVDGLLTNQAGLTLAIRCADCGPLFLLDPRRLAVGVLHSGKKGTQSNILHQGIAAMQQHFQTSTEDLIVVLGPCIRPPYYEVDFAADIRRQALDEGLRHFYDCGENTASHLNRFYSYRMEKGQTGRHYAAIRILPTSGLDVV